MKRIILVCIVISMFALSGVSYAGIAPISITELDIKPQSCPNPLNVNSKGVLPVAILGTPVFDATSVDVDTIQINGVLAIRSSLNDVSTPVSNDDLELASSVFSNGYYGPPTCEECTEEGPDGFIDLTLKFRTQDIVATLGDVNNGDVIVLTLTGELLDGTPIEVQDCVVIRDRTIETTTTISTTTTTNTTTTTAF